MSGNQINAKVSLPSTLKDKTRKGPNRLLTFDIISGWIKLQGFDEYTTNGLIELASKYPTNALPSFRKNFNLMIARVRQQRKLEQQGELPQQTERKDDGEEKTECEI